MYSIRPATQSDMLRIAPLLREADKNEIAAASGRTPEAALLNALSLPGECWHVSEQKSGDPILVCGLIPFTDLTAAVWMLATPILSAHGLPFLRACRGWVDEWNAQYPLLFNSVDARNDLHIRWLRWLGFIFISRAASGVNGENFIEFVRHKNV